MNLNIYIEDEIAQEITQLARSLKKSRNSLIREAIEEWLHRHQASEWPPAIMNFSGIKDFPSFESYRSELIEPKEDPLK